MGGEEWFRAPPSLRAQRSNPPRSMLA